MEIIIRQATLDDKNAIFEFIKTAYEREQPGFSQYKIPERWIWQFEKNPFISEKNNNLPIWLALDQNKIVGQYCAIPGEIIINKKLFNMGWGCDLIVRSDYRGLGIAYQLHTAFRNHFELTIGIGFAQATRRIWEKSGSLPLPEMSIFWFLIKLNKYFVYHYIKARIIHRKKLFKVIDILFNYMFLNFFIAIFVNFLFVLKKTFNTQLKYKIKSDIVEIFEFKDDINKLFNKTINEHNFIVPRYSKLLNWKFFQNDQLKYNVFVSKKDSEINGYIVLRKPHPSELNIGFIVDFYTSKNDIDTFKDLMIHAINYFGNSVSTIQCLTSVKEFEKLLHKIGFTTIKNYKPLVIFSNPAFKEKFKKKVFQCFITLIDHDLDQIEPI
jgi:hypothetical protein